MRWKIKNITWDMLSLKCYLDTHVVYKSLHLKTHDQDKNTHQGVTDIKLVFEATATDELPRRGQ